MELTTVGWREWVALPELGVNSIKAKIDTGARTSALHAFHAKPFLLDDGRQVIRFGVHPVQRHRHPDVLCEAPLIGERVVISSNGQRELRFVIRTMLQIGASSWPIEITLTDRDQMGFRMLLGRQALAGRFLVDPGSSYKFGRRKTRPEYRKGIRRQTR
jgi:hypothetical protein